MQTIASLPLTPGPNTVSQSHIWLADLARELHWPTRTTFALTLALDEALTNVIMHGFPGPAANIPTILLQLARDPECIVLDVIDNGVAFDPTLNNAPELANNLDNAVAGGHGLRLMRHYLDDIQYHYADGHNHLRLMIKWDANQAGGSI